MAMLRLLSVVYFTLLFSSATLSFAGTKTPQIKVVASFSILADWVRQVGGDQVEVLSLVDLDEDVHVYQASPSDLRTVANADVMFVNGLGLEGWLDRLIDTSGFKGKLVVLSDGIAVIETESMLVAHGAPALKESEHQEHEAPEHADLESEHEHEHEHDHDHDHGSSDPHAWLSPKLARVYVSNIADALRNLSADPSVKHDINLNAATYLAKLSELDQWIEQALSDVPVARRQVVVPHNAFSYFARDYHFTFHSLQGATSASETSAAAFASVVRKIRQENITSIFGENTGNPKLIERVAAEANLSLSGLLVSGALSRQLAPTYLDMMRHNGTLLFHTLGADQ